MSEAITFYVSRITFSFLLLRLLIRRGRGLGRRGLATAGLGVAFRQKLIEFPTVIGIHLGLGEELFRLVGFALREHLETIFREQIILQFGFRRLGIQL
jgi:hypothetical protein